MLLMVFNGLGCFNWYWMIMKRKKSKRWRGRGEDYMLLSITSDHITSLPLSSFLIVQFPLNGHKNYTFSHNSHSTFALSPLALVCQCVAVTKLSSNIQPSVTHDQ